MPNLIANLARTLLSTIDGQVQRRADYGEHLAEQRVKNGSVHGFAEIRGSGESLVDLSFPIDFLEKPLFTAGLELGDNTWPTSRQFPMWSATIVDWVEVDDGESAPLHTGATVAVVTNNVGDGIVILHYSFAGRTSATSSGLDVGGAL
jgi:hypothetical protein